MKKIFALTLVVLLIGTVFAVDIKESKKVAKETKAVKGTIMLALPEPGDTLHSGTAVFFKSDLSGKDSLVFKATLDSLQSEGFVLGANSN